MRHAVQEILRIFQGTVVHKHIDDLRIILGTGILIVQIIVDGVHQVLIRAHVGVRHYPPLEDPYDGKVQLIIDVQCLIGLMTGYECLGCLKTHIGGGLAADLIINHLGGAPIILVR